MVIHEEFMSGLQIAIGLHVSVGSYTVFRFLPLECTIYKEQSTDATFIASVYIVEYGMDFLALTETWIQPGENDNYSIGELCPKGYILHHIHRELGLGF